MIAAAAGGTTGRAARGLLAVLLVAAVAHAAWRMTPPLSGKFRHGFLGANAARYALAARNYVERGFLATRLAPDFTPGAADGRPRALYLHHPPLVPLVLGVSFLLFGESERSALLPFFTVGLLVLVLLFLAARPLLAGVGPGAAVVLAAVVPMTGFYGGHVDPQGPLLVAALLGVVLFQLRHRARGRGADVLGMALCLAAALATDWPALYVALLVPLADRFLPGGRRDRRLLVLPLLAAAFFGAHLAWILVLERPLWDALIEPARVRTALALVGEEPARLLEHAGIALGRTASLFTLPLLGLALVGLHPGVLRRGSRDPAALWAVLVVLGGSGLLHVLLFPQGFLVHDYWTFLLLPPLALAAGAAVAALVAGGRRLGEGFACLVLVAVLGGVGWVGDRATVRLYAEREAEGNALHARFGEAVREQTRPSERVLSNFAAYNPLRTDLLIKPEFTYYADRAWRGSVQTREELEEAVREEGPFDRYLWVPLGAATPPLVAELQARQQPREIRVAGHRILLFDLAK